MQTNVFLNGYGCKPKLLPLKSLWFYSLLNSLLKCLFSFFSIHTWIKCKCKQITYFFENVLFICYIYACFFKSTGQIIDDKNHYFLCSHFFSNTQCICIGVMSKQVANLQLNTCFKSFSLLCICRNRIMSRSHRQCEMHSAPRKPKTVTAGGSKAVIHFPRVFPAFPAALLLFLLLL